MVRLCILCGNSEEPLFEFPNHVKLRRKWFKILGRRYRKVDYNEAICIKHFRSSNIIEADGIQKLKSGAVPIFHRDVSNEKNADAEDQNESETPPESPETIVISSPKTVSKEGEKNSFYYAAHEERINLIFSTKFSFLQEQIPLKISEDLNKIMQEIILDDMNFQTATMETKVHCTVCDTHLGAAPIAQFDRFVHPVLNTLMCESCFAFYNTGDFTKDLDGSEIYCRWCAQGGTVMCCSSCPFVFCKQCVERNFGAKVCEGIANADVWECFCCNPSQLSKLQIMCSAVHEYTLKLIKKAMLKCDKEMLEFDVSICCKEDTLAPATKRKCIVLDVEQSYSNYQRKRLKAGPQDNQSMSSVEKKDNVTKRPPTPVKLRAIPTSQLQESKASDKSKNFATFAAATNVVLPVQRKPLPQTPAPISPTFTPSSSPPPLVPANSLPLRSQYTPISQEPPPLRPVMPVITKIEGNVGNLDTSAVTMSNNSTTGDDSGEKCPNASTWLRNVFDKTEEIVTTYLKRMNAVRDALRSPKTYTEYADLQNRMQHALSQCSANLIEARKVMHQEFLNSLTLQGVAYSSGNRSHKPTPPVLPSTPKPKPVANPNPPTTAASTSKPTLIIRNNGTNALKPVPKGMQMINQSRPILLKPPGAQPPILLRPTLTPIRVTPPVKPQTSTTTPTGLTPVLLNNQIPTTGTVKLINSQVAKKSIVLSQVFSKTTGNIVPTSKESPKKCFFVKEIKPVLKPVEKAQRKPPMRDPLAMSDAEARFLQNMQSDDILSDDVVGKVDDGPVLGDMPKSIKVEDEIC